MGFNITYKTVAEVNLWQHYRLDTPGDDFALPLDELSTPAAVIQRVLNYDLREILRIRPSQTSAEQLARRGLLFQATTTGCFIVSKNDYSESNAGFRLTLLISIVDPTWLDYTDIGSSAQSLNRRIFHLTNFGATASPRLLLTAGGNGALRDQHFVQRQGRVVRLRQQTPGTATTIEIDNALSNSATPAMTFTLPAISGQEEYELDARNLPEGLYNITSSTNNIDPSVHTNPIYLGLENRPDVIGVIDLFIAGWEETIYDVRLAKF